MNNPPRAPSVIDLRKPLPPGGRRARRFTDEDVEEFADEICRGSLLHKCWKYGLYDSGDVLDYSPSRNAIRATREDLRPPSSCTVTIAGEHIRGRCARSYLHETRNWLWIPNERRFRRSSDRWRFCERLVVHISHNHGDCGGHSLPEHITQSPEYLREVEKFIKEEDWKTFWKSSAEKTMYRVPGWFQVDIEKLPVEMQARVVESALLYAGRRGQ